MLFSIVVGLIATLATITMHALGSAWWIHRLKNIAILRDEAGRETNGQVEIAFVLSTSGVFFTLLHIAEVSLWAGIYLMFAESEQIQTFEDATYFSAVTYTSLGYGDIVLVGPRRLLSGMQAMVGLLTFGWSSALFFGILSRIWKTLGN